MLRNKAECEKLKSENKGIKKWLKNSEKDKDNINEHGFYDEQVYKLKNEHRQDKQKIREMYYDTLKKRKQLIAKHDLIVQREANIRKMKELIETTKRDRGINNKPIEIAKPESVVTGKEWDVDEMKKKVDTAKSKMKKEQNSLEKGVKSQDEKIKELEYQVKVCELKAKEKDKELSLANLKIKELKRNLRYNILKPLSSTPASKTSRKVPDHLKRSVDGNILKKRSKHRHALAGKRNSTDDYTRMSSNN